LEDCGGVGGGEGVGDGFAVMRGDPAAGRGEERGAVADGVGVGGDAGDEAVVEPGSGAAALGEVIGEKGGRGDLEAGSEAVDAAGGFNVVEAFETLGVGEDRGGAEEVEHGDGAGEDVESAEGEVGHLEENIAAAGVVGGPEAGAVEVDEVVEEGHFHGVAEADGDGGGVEEGLEAIDGGRDDVRGGDADAVEVVGGGDDGLDAVVGGHAGHFKGGGVVGGTVVEAWEDVGVEVDHGERRNTAVGGGLFPF
jgi:hypothetical protein